ncbi:hypothetical protein Tco_0883282 [Tanacetum coccineum]
MASGSEQDAKDALSKLLQMGTVTEYESEAFSSARAMKARFAKYELSKILQMGTVAEYQNEFEMLIKRDKVEITFDNYARDQASEVETLVDGKQDGAKVVKVVGVAVEQNNDEPNVLEDNGVISVGVNEINKWVDKEVQYSVSTIHVLIPLLKRRNDKHIKKKKMKAEIQKRTWNPGIKINFFRHHLEDKVVSKEWRVLRQ